MSPAKRAVRSRYKAKVRRLNRDLAKRRSERGVGRRARKAVNADKINRAYKAWLVSQQPKWKQEGRERP